MKKLLHQLVRIIIVVTMVVLVTTSAYFAGGGKSSRGLSDWLVYASFMTLAIGTALGIGRVGFKDLNVIEADTESDTGLETLVREFFRSGPFAWAVTLAAVACFLAAMLVDGLF